jgi:all-trans-retinol 13,14-reductase
MYGMMKDVQDPGSLNVGSRTRIPNLLLTGQSTTLHGMMGTMAGSLVTCAEVLSYEELFNQLKKAS